MWDNFLKTLQDQSVETTVFAQASDNIVFIKNTHMGRVRCDRTECRRNIFES